MRWSPRSASRGVDEGEAVVGIAESLLSRKLVLGVTMNSSFFRVGSPKITGSRTKTELKSWMRPRGSFDMIQVITSDSSSAGLARVVSLCSW